MFVPKQSAGMNRALSATASGRFLCPAEYRQKFETTLSHGRLRQMVRWFRLEQERRGSAYAKSGSWGRMGRTRESFWKLMRTALLQALVGHRTENDTDTF